MRSKVFEDITKSALAIDNYYKDDSVIVDIIQFSQVWGSTALGFDCPGGDMITNAITTVKLLSRIIVVMCSLMEEEHTIYRIRIMFLWMM